MVAVCYNSRYNIKETRVISIIQILLEFGADATHKQNEGLSVLDMALKSGAGENIIKLLMQQIAKMDCLKLEINETDQTTIDNNDSYKKYYKMCMQELEIMKETQFYSGVSVFSIFAESAKVVSGYARNDELVRAFEEHDYNKEFPTYLAWLKWRLDFIVKKQKTRITAAKVLSNLFKSENPQFFGR